MDVRPHLSRFLDQLSAMSDRAASDEIEHRLRIFELHRSNGIDPLQAFHLAIASASKKKRQVKKAHKEIERKVSLAERAKRGTKWRTLDRYSGELIELAKSGYGAQRLADYMWQAHRKKVSKRTVAYWLAERRKGGDL